MRPYPSRRPCPRAGCASIGHCTRHAYKQRDRGPVNAMYSDARWRRASHHYLLTNPCCVSPLHHGKGVPATVTDHITPHKGDTTLFWDAANWQPLCKPCHDSWKRRLENHADDAPNYITNVTATRPTTHQLTPYIP